ncbi:MAG: electron transfer flavoprotein subunit alpha/FixB family protein, partial [Thermodesulfobacteriota bacterium]
MEKIGLFIEFKDEEIKPAAFGMITGARKEDRDLCALVVNRKPADCKKELGEYGVDRVIGITAADGAWHPDLWADALVQAMAAFGIQTLLGVTSPRGRDILPRVAAQLDAPLLMDCLNVDLETHVARTTQYSGKTVATIRLTGTHRIYGVRANAVPAVPSPSEPSVETFTPAEADLPEMTVLETTPGRGDAVDLAEADVIFSGGRGMKNGENFKILIDCARTMNAAVGASRVAVDEGWVPYAMQVGQTGTK